MFLFWCGGGCGVGGGGVFVGGVGCGGAGGGGEGGGDQSHHSRILAKGSRPVRKKSCIRETMTLTTFGDNSFVSDLEHLPVFKVLQSMSRTPFTHGQSTSPIRNNSLFLRLQKLVHKSNPERLLVFMLDAARSMSRTPPTRGRSMGAIRNNSSFLRLHESVHKSNAERLLVFRFHAIHQLNTSDALTTQKSSPEQGGGG